MNLIDEVDYRLMLWAPTSASRAISAVAELLVINRYCCCFAGTGVLTTRL